MLSFRSSHTMSTTFGRTPAHSVVAAIMHAQMIDRRVLINMQFLPNSIGQHIQAALDEIDLASNVNPLANNGR